VAIVVATGHTERKKVLAADERRLRGSEEDFLGVLCGKKAIARTTL
jgi:hypothetical protein